MQAAKARQTESKAPKTRIDRFDSIRCPVCNPAMACAKRKSRTLSPRKKLKKFVRKQQEKHDEAAGRRPNVAINPVFAFPADLWESSGNGETVAVYLVATSLCGQLPAIVGGSLNQRPRDRKVADGRCREASKMVVQVPFITKPALDGDLGRRQR